VIGFEISRLRIFESGRVIGRRIIGARGNRIQVEGEAGRETAFPGVAVREDVPESA
jgi:hypothetical protein